MMSVLSAAAMQAQNNTSSPYTRYGYGELSNPGFGYCKSMGGLSAAVRNSKYINPGNPASFTAIDTMGFRFEVGGSAKRSSFSDNNGNTQASWDVNFDYMAMQFPISKWLAFSAGVQPFSFVGYEFGNKTVQPSTITADTLAVNSSYTGSGDISQVYMGLGISPFRNFSLGANVYYNFGTINHNSEVSFDNPTFHSTTQTSSISVHDWSVSLGTQYVLPLSQTRNLTWGATFDFKSKLTANADKTITTSGVDTVSIDYDNTFDLPMGFGTGFVYDISDSWTVGVDYKYQKWSDVRYFNETPFSDRHRIAAGFEFLPNKMSKSYFKRISYRAGLNYCNSYFKVNEKDFNQTGFSAGLGLPLRRVANPTILNIGFEYGRAGKKTDDLILEQYFKMSFNLTLNERWFVKHKFE